MADSNTNRFHPDMNRWGKAKGAAQFQDAAHGLIQHKAHPTMKLRLDGKRGWQSVKNSGTLGAQD